jgi:hypothetical protein
MDPVDLNQQAKLVKVLEKHIAETETEDALTLIVSKKRAVHKKRLVGYIMPLPNSEVGFVNFKSSAQGKYPALLKPLRPIDDGCRSSASERLLW